jgi:hypothetical protein
MVTNFLKKQEDINVKALRLIDFLSHVEKRLEEEIFSCNTFLHFQKFSADNYDRYLRVADKNRLQIYLYFIFFPFFIILRVFLIIFRNSKLPDIDLHFNRSNLIEDLFIGHITNVKSSNGTNPFYGSFLENKQKDYPQKSEIFYLDDYEFEPKESNLTVINSRLGLIELLKHLSKQIKNTIKILALFKEIRNLDFELLLLLKVIEHQFSYNTFKSIIISEKIKEFCESRLVSSLHLTFEGHGYESYTTKLIENLSTKIFLHIHYPITKGHIGVINFLNKEFSHVTISSCGRASEQFITSKLNHKSAIIAAGSNRYQSTQIKSLDLSKKTNLLILPEGTIQQTTYFITLACSLSNNLKDLGIIFRFHPNFRPTCLKPGTLKKLNHPNITVSNKSLNHDAEISIFSLFVGSSAAIESMFYGVYPIHVSQFKHDRNISNPLALIDEKKYIGIFDEEVLDKISYLKNTVPKTNIFCELQKDAELIFSKIS